MNFLIQRDGLNGKTFSRISIILGEFDLYWSFYGESVCYYGGKIPKHYNCHILAKMICEKYDYEFVETIRISNV